MSNGALPDYLSMAKPNLPSNRAPWYKNTAPTYAGIFLWFVFWSQAPSGGTGTPGGVLSQGVGAAYWGWSSPRPLAMCSSTSSPACWV